MKIGEFFRSLFFNDPTPRLPESTKMMEASVDALARDRKRTITAIVTMSKMDSDFNNVFEPIRIRPGLHR